MEEYLKQIKIEEELRIQKLKKKLKEDVKQILKEALEKYNAPKDKYGPRDFCREWLESMKNVPQLEKQDFKISSNWWELINFDNFDTIEDDGIKFLVNPSFDVIEVVWWKYNGQQLFTHEAAIRESKKANKSLPKTWLDIQNLIKNKYWWSYRSFILWENLNDSVIATIDFYDPIFEEKYYNNWYNDDYIEDWEFEEFWLDDDCELFYDPQPILSKFSNPNKDITIRCEDWSKFVLYSSADIVSRSTIIKNENMKEKCFKTVRCLK